MGRKSKFAPKVRERAVGLVRETRQSHESEWAAIVSVAQKIGCTPETLRKWTQQRQRDGGERPGLTTEDKARTRRWRAAEHQRTIAIDGTHRLHDNT